MPPKRRLDDDSQDGSSRSTPRTPKKARTAAAVTPRSSGRKRNGNVAADRDIFDFDQASVVSGDQDEEEDDELAQAQASPAVSRPRSARRATSQQSTPRKQTPRKVKTINDTPSKSTTRRRNGQTGPQQDDEDDPAANLILKLANEEQEDDHVSSGSEEGQNGASNGNGLTLHGGFEAYFDQASRKQKTSNNTLSKLPSLPHNEYLRIIKNYQSPHQEAIDALYESHVKAFPEWSFELDENYSICLTGYGSKKALIQAFCAREAEEFGDPFIVINGYHPNIDLRQICTAITTGLDASGTDVESALTALDEMKYERLILAIHNIDGTNLRSEKVQSQIARLVQHDRVRMICSIDHIHAPLLFSAARSNDLHLLFHDATTFEPYTLETELLPDTLSSGTKTALVGDRGIKWILQTLSQNARTIFRILLLEQIETGHGMTTARLFDKASKAFAVSNKTSYAAQMGEFLDHEIIVSERGPAGSDANAEVMRIPFNKVELERLLEDIDAGDVSDDPS